jgi:glycosidase
MRDFGGDVSKAKLAEALLFALPGTPFLYYGEEIGMQGGAARDDENKRTSMQWTASAPAFGFSSHEPWFRARESEAAGVDVADERKDPQSLWSTIRALSALRHGEPALTSSAKLVRVDVDGGDRGTLALLREDGAAGTRHRRVLIVASFAGGESAPFSIDIAGRPSVLFASGVHGDIHRAATSEAGARLKIPPLAPHGFAFIALDPP